VRGWSTEVPRSHDTNTLARMPVSVLMSRGLIDCRSAVFQRIMVNWTVHQGGARVVKPPYCITVPRASRLAQVDRRMRSKCIPVGTCGRPKKESTCRLGNDFQDRMSSRRKYLSQSRQQDAGKREKHNLGRQVGLACRRSTKASGCSA